MVPIRPNPPNHHHQRVFQKHKSLSNSVTKPTKSILKTKVEYVDSKDSGHETSSIHTDNSSEDSSSTSEHIERAQVQSSSSLSELSQINSSSSPLLNHSFSTGELAARMESEDTNGFSNQVRKKKTNQSFFFSNQFP